MDDAADELAGLRRFRDALKPGGGATLYRNGKDVTAQEIKVLDREIQQIEAALARDKNRRA